MSQWGNLDRKVLTGTFTVNVNSNAYVIGDASAHLNGNAEEGYAIVIANVNYRINDIVSDNVLIMDVDYVFPGSGANSGLTLAVQESPKDLFTIGNGANTQNKRNVFGVSADEAQVAENKARGFNQPGWAKHITYTDAHNQVRYKTETLVAMSKNFNENAAGSLQTDANDDTTLADYQLVFTTQPSNAGNTAGEPVVFTAAVASIPTGASISYQWQESPNAVVWASVSGGNYSGGTTNELTVANVTALAWEDQANVNEYYFRLVASTTGGADDVTSDTVYAQEQF